MNDAQQRALWGAALRSLGDSIAHGLSPVPTSMDVWTQYVSPIGLMNLADQSGPEPLKITHAESGSHASVQVPTGKPIDLAITWYFQALTDTDPAQAKIDRENYDWHNQHCVGGDVPSVGIVAVESPNA